MNMPILLILGGRAQKYIGAFFKVIDWDAVNANLKVAQAVSDAAKAAR
jgi:hypothetical protein